MIINATNTKEPVTEFTADLNSPGQKHCAYLHIVDYGDDQGKRIMYAGSCEFRQLLEAPDARRNKAWRKYVSPQPQVTVQVINMFDNPFEAFNAATALAREHKPYCNTHGERDQTAGMVKCLDDGETFVNAAAACKHYDIAPGSMSNHLNRRKGYGSIRGMKFERLTGE